MPFGCLVPRESGKSSNLSDITDKYELGQILKAKEFCELCLARERQSGQLFICKKFLKKDGRKVRRAAKNEILILQKLSHPNILQLMDTYETRKEYFIIQEIATGGDLFDWILDQGSYTERDAANVIRQVLEAVAYLHSLNIVHRNLKLENLMYYTENNQSKVVLRDFYLSTFENGSITEPCGTPEYLAPEVVTRHRYGRPVDCWAVGVIMYILLSGNPPFFDEAEEENTDLHHRIIFCRIAAGEFEFDSPYWDDISAAAKALVCRLMEVDQMLRITAPEALGHEWMTGQVASERNLKDVVCAQFERNFARSKWRKALCVTTFMQRLRTQDSEPRSPGGGERGHAEPQGAGKESAQGADGEVGEMRSRSERGVNRPAPPLSPGAECPAVSTGGAPSPAAPERQGRRGGEQPRSGARGRAEWEEQEELEEREELEEQEEWEEQACGSAAGRRPSASSVGSSPSSAPCLAATGATAPPAGQHEAAQQQGREGGGRGERVSGCQIPAGAAEGRAERGNGGSGGGVSHELGQPGRRQGEVHCGWEESAGTPPVAQEQTEAPLPESHCPSSRSPAGSSGGVQRRGSPGGVQRRVSPGGVQRRDSPGGVQRRGSPGGVQRRGSPGGVQRRDHMTEQTETQTLEKMEEDSPPMLEQRDNQNSCQTICPPLPTTARPSPPPHLQTFSQEGQDGLGDVVRPCRGALSPSGGQSGSGL